MFLNWDLDLVPELSSTNIKYHEENREGTCMLICLPDTAEQLKKLAMGTRDISLNNTFIMA